MLMWMSNSGSEGVAPPRSGARELTPAAEEAAEIALEAYIYAYPLVLMEASRRQTTNVEAPSIAGTVGAPMNQFLHMEAFPDATFTEVVRPNADTLYSPLWFDVSAEPLVVQVPDSGGRYYLLPMLDMWTDVFASPGKRTTGTGPQTLAIVGPTWSGALPPEVQPIRAPTSIGWIIGRTQANGKKDYAAVHAFQAGITVSPLSAWGHYYEPPKGKVDPSASKLPPSDQVAGMDGATFFTRFSELLRANPPHANDYPMLERMARLGLRPGQRFDAAKASPEVRAALAAAPAKAQAKVVEYARRAATIVNGWSMITNPVGTYGTDYLKRALIALMGLGANVVEDAIYPTAFTDPQGRPFDSGRAYVLHFEASELPPARAFWSLTMYNDKQLFTANPIDRYAIGDRDDLKLNGDGSLDLFIQRTPPDGDRKANWLPAPAAGPFTLNLRLYWPKPEALDGRWSPPPIKAA
jgi:hypothetical protein